MRNLKKAIEIIHQANTICIACHENPDGDAIASLVALGRSLTKLGKDVSLLSPDGVPSNLAFLTDSQSIKTFLPPYPFDLLILVDAESPRRLGKLQAPESKNLLILDHHPPSHDNALKIVDVKASSTAELVYEFIKKLSIPFDSQIIEAILVGIISDTGGLRLPNTTPKTLRIVAKLMESGGSLIDIYRKLYEEREEGYIKVLGEVLLRARRLWDGKIILSYIKASDRERYGMEEKDLEGIIDYLRVLKGWEVIFLLRETNHGVKVSIRSRFLDAGKFAKIFGGGGHKEAAGCNISLPLEEAEKKLLEELRKWMEC
ncbi:bifunctional oligoribonuclease/PAP phosphatase NrnA [bacterium]|nr:bifunctional oligoribonuclease/PAP phosphatase NrnA [bacterium]